MSNTYFEIKTRSKGQNAKRQTHNLRQKNLTSGDYGKKEFRNITEDLRANLIEDKKTNSKTKTEYSRDISKLRDRLKNANKETTKIKLEKKIDKLIDLRENTKKQETGKANFIELTMSITQIPKHLLRNQEYGKDIKDLMLEYVKEKFPNLNILSIAIHLDQSTPHMHLNGQYSGENNLTKDLVKKYDFNIDTITKGGKKDYMSLPAYKAFQERTLKRATKQIDNLLDKTIKENTNVVGIKNKDAIIDNLKARLIKEHHKALMSANMPKKTANIIETQEAELKILKETVSENNEMQILLDKNRIQDLSLFIGNAILISNDLDKSKIKIKKFEDIVKDVSEIEKLKRDNIILNQTLEQRDGEIEKLRELVPKSKSHNRHR